MFRESGGSSGVSVLFCRSGVGGELQYAKAQRRSLRIVRIGHKTLALEPYSMKTKSYSKLEQRDLPIGVVLSTLTEVNCSGFMILCHWCRPKVGCFLRSVKSLQEGGGLGYGITQIYSKSVSRFRRLMRRDARFVSSPQQWSLFSGWSDFIAALKSYLKHPRTTYTSGSRKMGLGDTALVPGITFANMVRNMG
ncbi:unnamed protein product [Linum trigynum]|uniref:Uncharacterized protein n=1 Tax=Linum trigynum TaxID=586398 RepID=A0AAV2GAL7_9ROSI